MGVILLGVERDGIFPQIFCGIGTGRDFFFVGVHKIHSRVTLCCRTLSRVTSLKIEAPTRSTCLIYSETGVSKGSPINLLAHLAI